MYVQSSRGRRALCHAFSGAAIVALMLLFAATAYAQIPPPGPVCNVSWTSQPVRAEGLTELLGEITLNCFNPWMGPLPSPLSISLTLTSNVTSNRDFGLGGAVTDAVAVVQSYNPWGMPTEVTRYGTLTNDKTLTWSPITFEPPGSTSSVLVRIANVRAKAFAVPGNLIQGTLLVSAGGVPVPVPPVPMTLAWALPGFGVMKLDGTLESFGIRVYEVYPNVFRYLGMPVPFGYAPDQESGYPVPGSGTTGGGATQGTRVRISFVDPPNGKILLPHRVQSGSIELRRVFNLADASGAGGCYYGSCVGMLPEGTVGPADKIGNDVLAVYEVTQIFPPMPFPPMPGMLDEFVIPVAVCQGNSGGLSCNPVSMAQLKKLVVRVSLAPVSTVDVSNGPAPEPRFNDTGLPLDILKFPK